LAFVTAHPAVSSAIIGPRTEEHLDDLLAGAGTAVAYEPPHLAQPHLRRRAAVTR
jgi:aryl-alcohol dehydrogenase-like predicted oxidoreductase